MSDRFYGEVTFPAWALQYLGQDLHGLSVDGPLATVEDEEAMNGSPAVIMDLEQLGIPYDATSAEYYEFRAQDFWLRFRPGGKTENKYAQKGCSDIDSRRVLAMLDERDLVGLRGSCEELAALSAPLTPALESITHEFYLAWLQDTPWVFQRNVEGLREGAVSMQRFYSYTPMWVDGEIPAGPYEFFGESGTFLVEQCPKFRCVDTENLALAEKDFPGVVFFLPETSRAKAAAFVPDNTANDALMVAVQARLRMLCGIEEVQDVA